MSYEHDAPAAYEEPATRTPSRVTRWWRALPRTGAGFALAVALAVVAWAVGLARGPGRYVVPVACIVLAEGAVWLVRRRA